MFPVNPIRENRRVLALNDKTSFQTPILKYNQGSWSDRVDARILGDEWTTTAFDDSKWRAAQKTDGTAWGPLRPRAIALLSQTPVPATPIAGETYPVRIPAGKRWSSMPAR